ncbi:MAG: hypothetical protein ACR2GQ_02795 [Gemmatimonadota bacterium]
MSRLRWLPHAFAAGVTLPFALWVATSDFRGVLHPAAWLMPLAGAYYLGFRIGREILRGIRRHDTQDEPPPRWTLTHEQNDHETDHGENR